MKNPVGAFVEGMINQATASLYVGFPAKVISFDGSLASIQSLVREEGETAEPIQNVPALGQKYIVNGLEQNFLPTLKAGDVVMVMCADVEIHNMLSGQIASPSVDRRHNINDAVIVGVFPCSL